ncbi:hypothetical protein BKK56_11660 [Rodentibacter genomosp. 2]|uniref:Uncharacterized protein n=1 Tax=Rodentibacter genomosp. 1 TaxID=1908264 RepID=A0A1V3IZQ3_9PAST|nr:hypothetical protein [Rodentibacter genomosp. 1]OOF47807.1 hypothetical protein BKK54_11350 [Rodentibacter genomosp. 1]OOF53210.1 hypothetical protein BKK56_11660 [Rodentibacter genomosp. 2]
MGNKFRITKESCEDLGFVKTSLFANAITKSEFNEWILFIIKNNSVDEIPMYMYDLIDFDDYLYKLPALIGFSPYSGLNNKEEDAIYGIAIKRFGSFFDMPISKNKALKALNENIQVLERFKNTFPFIKLDF